MINKGFMSSSISRQSSSLQNKDVWIISVVSGISLFAISFLLSALRHQSYQSSSHDLGLFVQGVWQISTGNTPYSSYLDVHILADHSSFFLYFISVLYKAFSNPIFLLFAQSAFLGLACIPLAFIGKEKDLDAKQLAVTLIAYCLYPVVINVSLFDFHPDVLSIPFFFLMLLAFEQRKIGLFVLSLVAVASTKAVLSLSIIFFGVSVILLTRQKVFGLIALAFGLFWYIFSVHYIIPAFSEGVFTVDRHAGHFEGLGTSSGEILINIFKNPLLVLSRLFSQRTLSFFVGLFGPIAYIFWSLKRRSVFYLVASIPTLAICLLSVSSHYVSFSRMYMIPLVPYLMLMVVDYHGESQNMDLINRQYRLMIALIVCIVGFIIYTDIDKIASRIISSPPERTQAIDKAILQIPSGASVLTTDKIAPHLSNRNQINIVVKNIKRNPTEYDYILLDKITPGWLNSIENNNRLKSILDSTKTCDLLTNDAAVYLYHCHVNH